MKVTHISSVDARGGAARAAFRLHQGLRQTGVDSMMLVQEKTLHHTSIERVATTRRRIWDFLQREYIDFNRTHISNTHFSLDYPGYDLTVHKGLKESDVVHLHWLAGFQSPPSIAQLAGMGKPMVWTLHDQRPFTGGCHFSAGCKKYEATCSGCPQLAVNPVDLPAQDLADKLHLWAGHRFAVVAPSKWLADCARASILFRNQRIETIPYGIDLDAFSPMPKSEARRVLNLRPDSKYLLFGADYGQEKRKGCVELAKALDALAHHPRFGAAMADGQISLICFGRPGPEIEQFPLKIKSLGYLETESALAFAYSAADIFLAPSLEDNLPNTVMESMSCGTPVAGFAAGGVPDLVIKETGRLAPAGDSLQLAGLIGEMLEPSFPLAQMGRACRKTMEENFGLGDQARRYTALYDELVELGNPPAEATSRVVTEFETVLPDFILAATGLFRQRVLRERPARRSVRLRQAGNLNLADALEATVEKQRQKPAAEILAGLEAELEKSEKSGKEDHEQSWLSRLLRVTGG